MKPSAIIFVFIAMFAVVTSGCIPANRLPLYQRSMVIGNETTEKEILSKASLTNAGDEKSNLKILYLKGTPYEMGFQHGRLLKDDIQNLYSKIMWIVRPLAAEDMINEIWDLMSPYIPIEEKEEMRGLAHGADVPLKVVHWIHCIPEVSEYGPKNRFTRGFKQTSCTNVAAFGKATVDEKLYHLRVLDWIRELGAQKWSVILIHRPNQGNASITFSYAGFIGCISGMNDKKMSFGEMGYMDPPNETLEGIPFIFLFRKLMREANNTDEALKIIQNAKRTCSYGYMITDAKAVDDSKKAVLIITDRDRFLVFGENTHLEDGKHKCPAVVNAVYGGQELEYLYATLKKGNITHETLIEIAKKVAMNGNMQNVIFKPDTFEVWISNASTSSSEDKKGRACNQKWFYFNFSKAMEP